ncbi:MAG: acyl-CoA dehydrogenase family protein [Deltaproteobacteria bacterium]|nr:acyl-CoA dehydrogenase family protein [Deltaproteobacteria bacterium]
MGFEPTEEQAALQALAHTFAEREIRPVAAHHDQSGEFPETVLRKAHALGLMNLHIPPRWGGLGLGVVEGCLIAEEIAWGCTGVGAAMEASGLALEPVIQGASEALLERYVAPMVERFSLAAYCITEPGAGSDVQGLRTRAEHRGDRWILNGEKAWITNAGVADWYFVLAMTDPALKARGGMTAFLVERSWPGVTPGRKEHNMGQRASDTRAITFEDVEVPDENVVGQVGQGWMLAMKAFDHTRPPVASAAVGLARAAMEHAVAYAGERMAFGVPIERHQAVAFLIADMAKDIDAARLLVWRAAWLADQGRRNTREASVAKAFAADVAMRVATDAVQVYGGYGYNTEYPVEKLMRDAKIFSIYEGTSQIQRVIVAREILGRKR